MYLSRIPTEDIDHRQREPEEQEVLPEGVIIAGNKAIISDKEFALAVFDSNYPVFRIDENGNPHLLASRQDVENHNGMYCASANDIAPILERGVPEKQEKSESEISTEKRDMALAEISAFTGISLTRLHTLPIDVKEDLLSIYQHNANLLGNETLKTELESVLLGKPISAEPTKQWNHLQTVEELVEGNYNQIDGVINNLPSDTSVIGDEKPSVLAALRELSSGSISFSQHNHSLDMDGDERQR